MRPHVLYIGLQRTGSTFLRGYFSAHPEIVWTREAHRLLSSSADRVEYPAALQQAYARYMNEHQSKSAQVWIDMFESVGMRYRLMRGERSRHSIMLSNADIGCCQEVDPDPAQYFEDVRGVLPSAKILLTIRNQVEWVISKYHHFVSVMVAGQHSFRDFLQTIEGRIILSIAHFDRLVVELHRIFGRQNVFVMPLEQIERDQTAALQSLSAFLGCSYQPFSPDAASYNRGIEHDAGVDDEALRVIVPSGERSIARRALLHLRRAVGDLSATVEIPSKRRLREEFGPVLAPCFSLSNIRLARLIDADLRELGYPH